jgi:hypothetical protein
MQTHVSSQAQQKSAQPKAQSTATRVPVRSTEEWEKPTLEAFDLCMEITAYVQHWQ